MKPASGDAASNRPLFIDFDLYTDGDEAFKLEFTQLMIDNLRELKQAVQESTARNNGPVFLGSYHKVAATVEMLNDPDLTQTLNVLRDHHKGISGLDAGGLQNTTKQVLQLIDMIARALTVEIAA